MKYLVTGGAGFIGSNLCRRLLKDGHSVACLDDLSTGKYRNIEELENNPDFEFFNHDLTKSFFPEKIDAIFNLACPASPVHYQYNPIRTLKMGTLAMYNVLGMAARLNVPILQASTSEIYGDPEVHPQTENYWGKVNPIGVRSCYDEGKRCAETLFFDYNRQHSLQIKVARIFNTYGPRMHPNDGRVVSSFIVQALEGKDITIYGDGTQTRSFCYIDDLIEAFVRFMDTEHGLTGPMNLGNPNEFTMLELAELTLKLINSKSELIFKDLPEDDPKQRQPDITLAKEKCGWEPKTQLKEGLQKTIDYFDSILK